MKEKQKSIDKQETKRINKRWIKTMWTNRKRKNEQNN